MIKNVNTIEEYHNIDRNALLLQTGKMVRITPHTETNVCTEGDPLGIDMGCNQ